VELDDRLAQVNSRQTLADFVTVLLADYEANPDGWENRELAAFLEAMAAWLRDMGESGAEPTWQSFGEILIAASMYE
jgi:class 3 adenylate cyclase